MKKTYVCDTNVLLSDPNALFAFDEHDVVIPMVVLEELDNFKKRLDDVGRNARQVNRVLDDMRQEGSLHEGIKLPNEGTLRVCMTPQGMLKILPCGLQQTKNDNLIIAFILALKEKWNKSNQCFEGTETLEPVLVSKDINVRLKCDVLGIKCEDYRKMRVTNDTSKFYTGVKVVEADADTIEALYKDVPVKLGVELFPNQVVVVKDITGGKSVLARCFGKDSEIDRITDVRDVYGIKPRNKEQTFSFDLLLDPDVKLVTLTGPSGTGKTLLSLAAALQQLQEKKYTKIVVTRPIQSVGQDIGFLPGTLEEKMEPWIAPIKDNLNFLMCHKGAKNGRMKDNQYLSIMLEKGEIEIEAISFIRGRSIPNAFIIVDECQNSTMHELKTILTRAGEGTKIALLGDTEQIDNPHVDVYTNGLTYVVERFKDQEIAGHVQLIKGERSTLATISSQVL